jgi:hypothetical protein
MDAYVWDEMQAPGEPGNVIGMVAGFDPYPVAVYPHFSRHVVELVLTVDGLGAHFLCATRAQLTCGWKIRRRK